MSRHERRGVREKRCGREEEDRTLKKRKDMNDYGWDKNLNISTMGRNDLHEDYHHFAYEPTAYSVLLRFAERGYISEENTLIDYGCGKGRVSFLLSRRTGCRAIGIEYNDEIYEIAVQNLEHFRGDRGKITFVNADAEHFDLPPEADRFYFFNPFSVEVLKSFVAKLVEEAGMNRFGSKKIELVFYYLTPEYQMALREFPLKLEQISKLNDYYKDEFEKCCIYSLR